MPRRILACLLPLFCLLLTACTDTPSGQLTPVDVYVPPVTEGRSDAPASWTSYPGFKKLPLPPHGR